MESMKKEIWGPWATAGWGFLIFIVWSLGQAVPVLIVGVSRLRQNGGKDALFLFKSLGNDGMVLCLAAIIGGLAAFGLIWLVILLRKGAKLPEYLDLHPLKGKTALGVLGISALFFLASDCLTYFLGRDIVPQFEIQICSTCSPVLVVLGVVLAGPLFEEIYFRGFLFEGFRNSRLGNVGAALLTTAAWACLHFQYDFYQVATVFAGGLVLALIRVKTGSLRGCILFHVLMNGWSTVETILFFHGWEFLHLTKA